MEENAILLRIKEYMRENDWTVYHLAKESGMAYSSLNNLFRRNTEPTLPTLRKICDGLGVSLSAFFNDGDTPVITAYTQEERTLVNLYRSISKKRNSHLYKL